MLSGHLTELLFGENRTGKFIGMALIVGLAFAFPVASVVGLSTLAWKGYAREASYRQRFGDDWKTRFEAEEGPLRVERVKIGAEILGVVANAGLGIWFYRMLIPTLRNRGLVTHTGRRSRRKRRRS